MFSDCLLPSARPAPPPFSQEECQELIKLLETLGEVISLNVILTLTPYAGNPNLSESQNVVHTRIVSRILMRLGKFLSVYELFRF